MKKHLHSFLLTMLGLMPYVAVGAAVTDTISVYSSSMRKVVPAVVVRPSTVCASMPVVYLLHGFSDSYANGWINKGGDLAALADRYGCLMVMPDGGFSSWYFDSPEDPSYRYETFVAEELVAHVDSCYDTRRTPAARAITGNSMGGHGALYLALRHPDVFGMAGSMSGGVNLCPFSGSFDISKRLGSYDLYPERWKENSVVNMVERALKWNLQIIMSCGTDDFFYNENVAMHEKMRRLGIPHVFITGPGAHSWDYWADALKYQMLFFNGIFPLSAAYCGSGNMVSAVRSVMRSTSSGDML